MENDTARQHPDLAQFWRRELERTLDGRGIRPPSDLADDLERLDLRAGPIESVRERPSQSPSEGLGTAVVIEETEFERAWSTILPTARALRTGALPPGEIAAYREDLEALVGRFATQREVWAEMLLVIISYQRNRADAAETVRRARAALSTDLDLKQLERIIDLWGGA
jgi:hypothetical protein